MDTEDKAVLIRIATELDAIRESQIESRADRKELRLELKKSQVESRADRKELRLELKKEIGDLRRDISNNYVTNRTMELTIDPLRKISYGLVGSMVTVVISLILMIANAYF